MEHESDAVKLGKLLHRDVFKRDEKEVQIGPIAIDVVRVGDSVEIREIKKSRKMEDSYVYQTLYYLYYLKRLGINARAVISFPKRREIIEIELSKEDESRIEEVLKDIEKIIHNPMPKPEYRRICRKCAYFEFCFA
jgi:CRISPR-associated exonuclease Cas4